MTFRKSSGIVIGCVLFFNHACQDTTKFKGQNKKASVSANVEPKGPEPIPVPEIKDPPKIPKPEPVIPEPKPEIPVPKPVPMEDPLTIEVVSATDGKPIPDAKVEVAAKSSSCTTDTRGQCQMPGENIGASGAASATNYAAETRTLTKGTNRFVLSPKLKNDENRFVLTWGGKIADVDAHLKGPNGFHLFYNNADIGNNSMDIDDTEYYGPETTTVRTLKPGKYKYSVIEFDRIDSKNNLSKNSDAEVRVFQPDREPVVFKIPRNESNPVWNVFTFEVDSAGRIGTIVPDGTFTDNESQFD